LNKSETIVELAKALSRFQAEVKNPANTANNPFYKSKYAPLSEILNVVRPVLANHGLSVMQMPGGDSQETSITTVLMHESGEWIESEPLTMKSVKNDPQGAGSVITYARRYSISAILGISSEGDDDANSASGLDEGKPKGKTEPKSTAPPKPPTQSAQTAPPPSAKDVITEPQRKRLFAICSAHNVPDDVVKAKIKAQGFDSSKDLTRAAYDIVVAFAEEWVDDSEFTMPEEVD